METKQLKEQSVIICLHPCTKLCEQSKDFKLSIKSGAGFLPWQFITRPHREAVCDVWDWMQFMSADILLKMVMHYSFIVQSNTWRCWVILSRPINYLPKRKIVVILNNKTLCGGTQQHHWSQSSWQREAGATAATNSYLLLIIFSIQCEKYLSQHPREMSLNVLNSDSSFTVISGKEKPKRILTCEKKKLFFKNTFLLNKWLKQFIHYEKSLKLIFWSNSLTYRWID